jgi:YegS/Rv2252/BmrU family lipid kinase
MTQNDESDILFVINPISGGKQKTDHETAIKNYFESLPQSISFFLLNGKNDAQNLEKHLKSVKPKVVVAVGGDGTVTLVAKKILGTDIQLGIIPAGSANGMARELNIPINIEQSLDIIVKGNHKKADVLKINSQVCLHLSDIGLNAQLIKYFEQGNSRGIWGYAKVALKTLVRQQHMKVIIEAKDSEIKRSALMVVLANASKYGTGAVINPIGDLYDGLFEVVIIRKLSFMTFVRLWLSPTTLDPQYIEVVQAQRVHVQTHRKVHFQIDGEYIGRVKRVDAEILSGKLNILVPES